MSLAKSARRILGTYASAALTLALCAAQAHAAAPRLVVTADTEGHITPCKSCPGETGLGGLARRGVAIAAERQAGPILLVDAGNFLFGDDSTASGGRIMIAGYQALGYDIVNISYRDFREGKAATLALLADDKLGPVSANILDADSGKPLFAPYRIKEIGGEKVAFLGLTEAPVGMNFLPHLKKQLAGIRIAPPSDALAQWLPKARADAGKVVLIYYGSAQGLSAINRQAGEHVTAIVAGDLRPEHVPNTATPVIAAQQHGKDLAMAWVSREKPEVRLVAVTPGLVVPADSPVNLAIAPYVGPGDGRALPSTPSASRPSPPSPLSAPSTVPAAAPLSAGAKLGTD